MQCDMCGKEDRLFIAEVEGTELKVCKNCASFGKLKGAAKSLQPEKKSKKKEQNIDNLHKEEQKKEIILRIMQGYGLIVKNAREKLGLKQEELAKKINEKISIVHSIETERHEPSISLAEKIEHHLHIKLIEQYEETHETFKRDLRSQLTIGDLITIKKR
jgi:putative transcription factor